MWRVGGGVDNNKKPPVVRAAFCCCLGVSYFFVLTVAIPTGIRSLIIRIAIRMTIRERTKNAFIWLYVFRPIIGIFGNKSRATFPFTEARG